MATFLLLSGTWHTPTHWNDVRALLEAKGHKVYTPLLYIADPSDPSSTAPFQTFKAVISNLLEYITQHNLQDIILVAHSYGGVTTQQIAPMIKDRIRCMVFISSFLLPPGESTVNVSDSEMVIYLNSLVEEAGENRFICPPDMWRNDYMNTASRETQDKWFKTIVPFPYGLFQERVQNQAFYEDEEFQRIPRCALIATDDVVFGKDGWLQYVKYLGDDCRLYHDYPGDHEILLTNPELLVRKILEAVGNIVGDSFKV